jgi:hypothetical protein
MRVFGVFISTARLKSKSTPNVLKATKKALEQYHASGFKVSIIRTDSEPPLVAADVQGLNVHHHELTSPGRHEHHAERDHKAARHYAPAAVATREIHGQENRINTKQHNILLEDSKRPNGHDVFQFLICISFVIFSR